MPEKRRIWKLRHLYLGEKLTSRIARSQAILHTGKEPMVMSISSITLCLQYLPERGANGEHNDVADTLRHRMRIRLQRAIYAHLYTGGLPETLQEVNRDSGGKSPLELITFRRPIRPQRTLSTEKSERLVP